MYKRLVYSAIFVGSIAYAQKTPQDCSAGSYYHGASKQCYTCPKGTFNDKQGAYDCLKCPAGTYAEKEGSIACKPVPAGFYGVADGATIYKCDKGTYSKQGAASRDACKKCENGYYNDAEGATQCKIAPAGTYVSIDGASIRKCEKGTYSDKPGNTISGACKKCEPGYYMDQEGATVCKVAPGGNYVSMDSTTIYKCDKGTYAKFGVPSKTDCRKCELGHYNSNEGSTECTLAPTGHYVSLDNTAILPCDKGTYNDRLGASSKDGCKACEAGYYSSQEGASQCRIAPAGQYVSDDKSTVYKCDKGTYAPREGTVNRASCKKCEPGFYNDKEGSLECKLAPAGSYVSVDSSSIFKCAMGTYADKPGTINKAACKTCEPGYYSDFEGALQCKIAPPGTYASEDKSGIKYCDKGTFSDKQGAASKAECKKCDPGYYNDKEGATSCKIAPVGYYVSTDSWTINKCPKGTYSDKPGGANRESCMPCPSGFYSYEEGANGCIIAPVGHYVSDDKTTIYKCDKGTYSNKQGTASRSECIACPSGYYTDVEGSTACKPVPAGFFINKESTGISKCDKGTYSKLGAANRKECKKCEDGTYNNVEGATECKVAPIGYYVSLDSSTINACDKGTFNDRIGGANSTACLKCESGYYQNELGQASCKIAQPGYYASMDLTTTFKCEKGTYTDKRGTANREGCKRCESGWYTTEEGSSACQIAPAGYYVSTDSSAIYKCDKGTYSKAGTASKADCKKCEPGYFNNVEGATECKVAPAGHYVSLDGTNINKCEKGSFSAQPGAANIGACKKCEPGYYANEDGSITCKIAPAGHYVTLDSTNINKCEKGTYSEKLGAASKLECKKCEPGYFSSSEASTECRPAPVGYYVSVDNTAILKCDKGTFNDKPAGANSAACKKCEPGFYNSQEGAAECKIVPAGSYPSHNQETIFKCPDGTNSSNGAKGIEDCKAANWGVSSA